MIKLTDVAAHLNLSRITVSAVLNQRYKSLGISEATAQRVRRAAREMGYQRNQLALAVKTGRTHSLGFALGTERFYEWQAQVMQGALEAVADTDYLVKTSFVANSAEIMQVINQFLGRRVEGIYLLNLTPPLKVIRKLHQAIERHALMSVASNCHPEIASTGVEPDHETGCRLAIKHLVDLGHRRIAFLGGDSLTEAAVRRKNGFLTSLAEFELSLDPGHLHQCDWQVDKVEAATIALLKDPETAPTAIVCANGDMAVVAMRQVRRLGLRVPRDLSVVGFSNEILTELSDPPLTVVDMHHDEVGRKAVELLLQSAGHHQSRKRLPPGTHLIPASLIIRESTAQARCRG